MQYNAAQHCTCNRLRFGPGLHHAVQHNTVPQQTMQHTKYGRAKQHGTSIRPSFRPLTHASIHERTYCLLYMRACLAYNICHRSWMLDSFRCSSGATSGQSSPVVHGPPPISGRPNLCWVRPKWRRLRPIRVGSLNLERTGPLQANLGGTPNTIELTSQHPEARAQSGDHRY